MQLFSWKIEQIVQTVVNDHARERIMANARNPSTDPGEPLVYQIRIKGHLDPHWASWFEGLAITLEDNGETLLTGPLVDQAALHGLLRKVRDLGLPLLSVACVKASQAETSEVTDGQ
jgi:hypothetical protein